MMPDVPTWVKKIAEWAALAAVFGSVGSLWVNSEVERRMNELAIDPASTPVVVRLETEVDNIESTVSRIENKVDAFGDKFLDYLERQAGE
jgi:hypothetical protein